MIICDEDHQVGGKCRCVWRNDDGHEISMNGVNREVIPPERIVRNESFDFGCEAKNGEQLSTLVLANETTGLI